MLRLSFVQNLCCCHHGKKMKLKASDASRHLPKASRQYNDRHFHFVISGLATHARYVSNSLLRHCWKNPTVDCVPSLYWLETLWSQLYGPHLVHQTKISLRLFKATTLVILTVPFYLIMMEKRYKRLSTHLPLAPLLQVRWSSMVMIFGSPITVLEHIKSTHYTHRKSNKPFNDQPCYYFLISFQCAQDAS